jgi:hypothetical protein
MNTIANTKDPGIAAEHGVNRECSDVKLEYTPATVYFVHRLNDCKFQKYSIDDADKSLLRNQRSLPQDRKQHYKIQVGSPEPMPGIQTVGLFEVSPEHDDREPKRDLHNTTKSERAKNTKLTETDQTVVQRVHDPEPESGLCEERILLAQGVELRIPIQDTGGDELVKDADDERRQDGENDIVQGQRPRLIGDLSGEVVEERILYWDAVNI